MRLHYGAVPEDSHFDPVEDGWTRVREPGPFGIQIMALPAIVLIYIVLGGLIYLALPRGISEFEFQPLNIVSWIVFLLFIPVHELLHALCHPGWGMTPNTVIGLWPSRLLFYAFYQGQVKRGRLLVAFATPFVVLSLLPIGLLAAAKILFPMASLVTTLVLLSLLNGAAASGDVIGFCLVLFQIPAGATVRNKGWRSYWKKLE